MSQQDAEFLYRFSEEERAVVQRRFREYTAAVAVIAELHGLPALGVPLRTDAQNIGFIAPPGVQVQKGES